MQMRRCTRLTPLLAALFAVGCSSALPGQDTSGQANMRYGSRVHKMPMRDSAITPNSAPAGAHLTYYGGRVVSNMQVVQVIWGGGNYLPQVTSTATPSMATFYQQSLNSAYVDWLTEYNTSGGTNQTVGHGSFAGQFTITPSVTGSVSDAQIQSELAAQINAGHLPHPTRDAAGNNNTYYAIFFPNGTTITQGGSSSCVAGGFCAYHGTVANAGGNGEIYYGVHPDMQAGSGCDTGCGSGTPFGNYTSVASHEMIETITDCEVGLATTNGPPLAWYDNTNGEIGDICNAQQGSITGTDGVSYTVQKEFSNTANDCIVSRAVTPPSNDFSVSVSPSSQTVNAGSSISYTVTTATVSGSAQTVSLAVSGLPSGVTGAFSPTSVSSGQTSTLTLTAASGAASATATFTVTGSATSGSHTATASVTVAGSTPPPPPPPPGGGITNGDFETGTLSGWTATGASETVISSGCHGGTYCAQLGSTTPTNGDSTITQTFTAPSGTTGITLWYKETCPDTITYDWALATLKDNTAGTSATLIAKACATNSWTSASGAVTAGHSYTLTLTSHDDNYSGDPTYTLFDDVALSSSAPPPPPPTGGGITNGGFETGTLSGWTSTGASETVVTGGRSGTYAARLGSTTPTNGDSSISQTFTVPSGKSQLSIWYKMSCPDTITYDWATVTLKSSTGTTTTVLPKTCATNGSWVNVTASVSAGSSYTVTLTSHDDNYSADPTYTLFDDVSLN